MGRFQCSPRFTTKLTNGLSDAESIRIPKIPKGGERKGSMTALCRRRWQVSRQLVSMLQRWGHGTIKASYRMRNICVTLVLVAWRMVEESVGMACSRLHQIPSLDLGFLPLRNLGA